MSKTYIGTSGWMYKDWGEKFYPKGLKKGHLGFLATVFNTVELNASFYRLPARETFEKWKAETPADFRFAVKLSRLITHLKRFKDVEEPLQNFLVNAAGLGRKLGVVLIQTPPSFRYDIELIDSFLETMIREGKAAGIRPLRIAFEPRHATWFEPAALEETRKLFKKFGVAFVFADSTRFPNYEPSDESIVTKYAYLRFHGPRQMFASEYKADLLKPWAKKVKEWQKKDILVFAYFNNDVNGYAAWDAQILAKLAR